MQSSIMRPNRLFRDIKEKIMSSLNEKAKMLDQIDLLTLTKDLRKLNRSEIMAKDRFSISLLDETKSHLN